MTIKRTLSDLENLCKFVSGLFKKNLGYIENLEILIFKDVLDYWNDYDCLEFIHSTDGDFEKFVLIYENDDEHDERQWRWWRHSNL